MEDILNVNNSIWVKVQMKKKDDINYLEEIKNSGQKEKYINAFMTLVMKIYEIELEKYLLKNEIIIKYFLNKVGLLSNILGIFQQSNDEFLFKIDYKKFLYKNDATNEHHPNYTRSEFLYNTLSTNETQFSVKEKNIKNDSNIKNNIETELKKIFENSIKIIIRQERLNNNYIEKIKLVTNKTEKDNKSNMKNSNSKEVSQKNIKKGTHNMSMSIYNTNNNNNSVITSKSKSSKFKKKRRSVGNKLISKLEELTLEESLDYNLTQEKNNIKYRLMFLYCFIKRYIKLINECFSTVYNNMDDWIIMNLETQNNKLNEFITYLKRALDKNFETITMEGREFDYNEKYIKNKKYILPLYKTLYPDEILNLNIKFSLGDNFANNLIKLNNLNLVQQYVYNLNDLNELYNSIKEYGIQTCDYFVKYEIVKNIFINKVINEKEKEYSLFYENNNKNTRAKNTEEKIFNGVCKRMKFYSCEKIDKFIQIFSVYENKYININSLFTTLLIIGSELISSQEFYSQINQYIPEELKNNNHILLSLSQFMKINFWFENDQYLNELSDLTEQSFFQGQYSSSCSINQINNGNKNKNPLDEFFMSNNFRKSSEYKKLSLKLEKRKKIDKIKETIFDINKNSNGFIDIKIIGDLLDLLNNYCKKKEEGKNKDKNDKGSIDIDENDKCFRFSSDDLDDYIYNKTTTTHGKQHMMDINKVINNIFNKIFEN